MICKNCYYREDREIDDTEAFDMEPRLRVCRTKIIDYCAEHDLPCEDAYRDCQYRDIIIQADDLIHIRNLYPETTNKINELLGE